MGNKSGRRKGGAFRCMKDDHIDQATAIAMKEIGKGGDIDANALANTIIKNQPAKQMILLGFNCENLVDNTFSKLNPMLILSKQQKDTWIPVGKTEVLKNNLNPEWVTKLTVEFKFERREQYKVDVYDIADASKLDQLDY